MAEGMPMMVGGRLDSPCRHRLAAMFRLFRRCHSIDARAATPPLIAPPCSAYAVYAHAARLPRHDAAASRYVEHLPHMSRRAPRAAVR